MNMRHWSPSSRDTKALVGGSLFTLPGCAPPYVTAPRLLRPKVDSASHVRSDLVRIRALYTPGAQASNHSIMEARSPFSGRFAASEIS